VSERIRVGNTDIGPATDFEGLLRRQFLGGTPFSGRYDETAEQGALSLFAALKDTPFASRAADAVTGLLTDDNLDVRAGAVAVVEDFPQYFDGGQILRLLNEHSELYEGVGTNHFGRKQPDLAWALMRGLAAMAKTDPAVRDRLRKAAQDPVNGTWVLAGVTSNDADWVINHPAESVQGDPSRAWIVMLNLGDNRERFLRMVPKESPELRDAVRRGVERAVRDEKERNRLLALLPN
jgi:hypothetical protein